MAPLGSEEAKAGVELWLEYLMMFHALQTVQQYGRQEEVLCADVGLVVPAVIDGVLLRVIENLLEVDLIMMALML